MEYQKAKNGGSVSNKGKTMKFKQRPVAGQKRKASEADNDSS